MRELLTSRNCKVALLLPLALSLAAVLLTVSCGRVSDCDLVLDDFSEVVQIAPADSVDLEQFGIFIPEKVIPHDDWYIIGLFSGNNIVDIVNPETKETIHCFRKGRGPGEILNTGPIQELDGDLLIFDISRQTYYMLDVDETIKDKEQMLKGTFYMHKTSDGGYENEPLFHTFKCNDYIIATGLFNDGTWIRLVDRRGSILDGIPLVDFESTNGFSNQQRAAFQLSSFFSANNDGRRGICAMLDCATFSIFDIEGKNLHERTRKIYYEPRLYPPQGGMISPAHDRSNTRGFFDAACTDENVWLLFSGRNREEQADLDSECRHLLVYDWDGNPVRRYELKKTVNSIFLKDGRIYGTSRYPYSRVFIYDLEPST